jgi:DNA helicase II / ATP-dependent DNA helicase PcrA
MYPEYRVKRLTLDMLAKEKPLIFELDRNGEYKITEGNSKSLDPEAIKSMVETARKIAYDFEHGFKETDDPEICKECGFRLYCDGINL